MCMPYKVFRQYCIPQHILTRFGGWLSNRRWRWWKNWQINYFINRYQVDIKSALEEDIQAYPTFNSFFTRLLKPEARPIVSGNTQIACPVDGSISQMGHIQDHSLFQAKGFYFNLTELLGGFEKVAALFQEGEFATLYLSPKDYHRVHMPIDGTLRETIFVPGRLFSVNQQTVNSVPALFARNERLICLFDTAIGPIAVILIGAMIVGSINTVWGNTIKSKRLLKQVFQDNPIHLKKGDELGHFKLGSTVILLFPKNKICWEPSLQEKSTVQMGQLVAESRAY